MSRDELRDLCLPFGSQSLPMPTVLAGPGHPDLVADETTLAHDRGIRAHLRWRLKKATEHLADTLVVEELPVCSGIARVDLAVLNGSLHGFEIKSERDTLARLTSQASYFSEVADYMTLVVVEPFLDEAVEIVPKWWGISTARRSKSVAYFETVRPASQSPDQVRGSFLEFLWRDEAFALLEQAGGTKRLRSATKSRLCAELERRFPWSELHPKILAALKSRLSRTSLETPRD